MSPQRRPQLRLIPLLLLAACSYEKSAEKPVIDAAVIVPDAEPPPKLQPAPKLEAVEGASAADGQKLFLAKCASCHGNDGRTPGPQAEGLRRAPTDLGLPVFMCRTTVGRPVAVPSDIDVESAITRGSHAKFKELLELTPAQKRSLTMYVKSLSREYDRDPMPLSLVEPETPDGESSRRRGRLMYLAFGCWRCHGTDGKGTHADAVGMLKWNGRPLVEPLALDEQEKYLCGSDPERIYRTISIGMGGGIMPPYQGTIEAIYRPDREPPRDWGKALKGKIPDDDLKAVRGWYGELPEQVYVRGMTPSQRRKRAGEMIWDMVHYLRSL